MQALGVPGQPLAREAYPCWIVPARCPRPPRTTAGPAAPMSARRAQPPSPRGASTRPSCTGWTAACLSRASCRCSLPRSWRLCGSPSSGDSRRRSVRGASGRCRGRDRRTAGAVMARPARGRARSQGRRCLCRCQKTISRATACCDRPASHSSLLGPSPPSAACRPAAAGSSRRRCQCRRKRRSRYHRPRSQNQSLLPKNRVVVVADRPNMDTFRSIESKISRPWPHKAEVILIAMCKTTLHCCWLWL